MLVQGLQAIASQVLSAPAVGMFRLLQHEFAGRDALLAAYQENGIARGRATLAAWLQRQQQLGWLRELDTAQTSDLLLAMTMAEPLRQMALGFAGAGQRHPRAHRRRRSPGPARLDARVGVLPQRATSCH